MKEKLLCIKNILIEADKENWSLPDDVVSRLMKEELFILEIFSREELINKSTHLEFLLNTPHLEKEIKKQLLIKLIKIGQEMRLVCKQEAFHRYVVSIIAFSNLEPSKEQLEKFVDATRNRADHEYFTDIITVLGKIGIEKKEILTVLDGIPIEKPETNSFATYNIVRIIDLRSTYEWIKKNKISREDFLEYLSSSIKNEKLSQLLLENEFKKLELNTQDFKMIMNDFKEQQESFTELEYEILNSYYFLEQVNEKRMTVSRLLNFIQEQKSKEDILPIQIFNHLLPGEWNRKVDSIEFSKQIAAIIHQEKKGYSEGISRLLNDSSIPSRFSEKNMEERKTQFLSLLTYLLQLDTTQFPYFMRIVNSGILKSEKGIQDITDYLKQFEKLSPRLLSTFSEAIASYSVRTTTYDSAYYDLYPYLIQKLSDRVTQEEKEKLETALSILGNEKSEANCTNNIRNIQEIIDLLFETKYDWQRKNIQEVALDKYPADIKNNTYLMIIKYMAEMKQRDKKEFPPKPPTSRYRHFQAQIDEVNAMLEELEQPKTKRKKIGE